jgi:hypothetical protein
MPGAVEHKGEFRFDVERTGKLRSFTHIWRERVHPKKTKVPNPDVIVLTVPTLEVKAEFLETKSGWVFTEPHYDGYASILVRLPDVSMAELEALIRLSWQCQASKVAN